MRLVTSLSAATSAARAASATKAGGVRGLKFGQVGLCHDTDQLAGCNDRQVAQSVFHHHVQHIGADGRGWQNTGGRPS